MKIWLQRLPDTYVNGTCPMSVQFRPSPGQFLNIFHLAKSDQGRMPVTASYYQSGIERILSGNHDEFYSQFMAFERRLHIFP